MHPEHVEMHLPHFLHVLAHHFLMLARLFAAVALLLLFDLLRGDLRRVQLVGLIPADRVRFQRIDHFRQRFSQGMLGLPSEQIPCASNIEFVVVIGDVDHPRSDKRVLVENLPFNPGAGPRERFRDRARFPILIMNQAAKVTLELTKTERFGLAQKN